MKKKIYDFVREYSVFIILIIVSVFLTLVPLPYYVEGTGGLISVSERFSIDGLSNDSNYHMAYVSSYKGTISNILMALIRKDYNIYKETKESGSSKENNFRNHLMLEEANQDALIYAYLKANKKVKIIKEEIYITYIDDSFDNNFKIGDKLISVNNILIDNRDTLQRVINDASVGEKLIFEVENNNKEERYAYVKEIEGNKKIGVLPTLKREIEVEPEIKFYFDESESGSSGGFMMTLAIYDSLTNSEFSNNLKIAGTGTIDINGNVGKIGGVKYKILGAIKDKADIFFVPKENYDEARKTLKEEETKMKLIMIETFDDALNYLKKYG